MFGGERQAKMSRTEQAVSSTVDPYPLTEADKQLFVTGRKLEDDYILHEMLDRGTYANVFLGTDRRSNQQVAVKRINKRLTFNNSSLARMIIDEIRILHHLKENVNGEGILQLIASYYDEGRVCIVTKLYNGGNLFDRIFEMYQQGRKYSEKECAKMFHHLFSSLAKLHNQGFVLHNDLKHENFLLESTDLDSDIVIADFGMAVPLPRTNTSKEIRGPANGTLGYMAPELLDRHVHSIKTDSWAMGVALYIALKASLPFNPQSVKAHGSRAIAKTKRQKFHDLGVSDDAADIIRKLLEIDPNERYSASDALQHPFLRKYSAQSTADLSSLIPPLKKFKARQKLRAACRAVEGTAFLNRCGMLRSMISERDFPAMNFAKLREVFNKYCKYQCTLKERKSHHDFAVDRVSFANILKELDLGHLPIDQLFSAFDTDENGSVDFKEFLCGLALLHGPSEKTLALCFEIFDQDSDGRLDSYELRSVLEFAASGNHLKDREIASELENVMEELDTDGDGFISFSEFRNGIQKYPLLVNALLGDVQSSVSASGRRLYVKSHSQAHMENANNSKTVCMKRALLVTPEQPDSGCVEKLRRLLVGFGVDMYHHAMSLEGLDEREISTARRDGFNVVVICFDQDSVQMGKYVAGYTDLPVLAFPSDGIRASPDELQNFLCMAVESDSSDPVCLVMSVEHAAEAAARICNSSTDVENLKQTSSTTDL